MARSVYIYWHTAEYANGSQLKFDMLSEDGAYLLSMMLRVLIACTGSTAKAIVREMPAKMKQFAMVVQSADFAALAIRPLLLYGTLMRNLFESDPKEFQVAIACARSQHSVSHLLHNPPCFRRIDRCTGPKGEAGVVSG